MTRETFQAAIEAGIHAAGLSPEQAEPLRAVGRTATRSVTTAWIGPDCRCPAEASGLAHDGGVTPFGSSLGLGMVEVARFITHYDQHASRHATLSRVFNITDPS